MTPENVRRAAGLLNGLYEMRERIAEEAENDMLWRAIGSTITLLVELGVDLYPHIEMDRLLEEARARHPVTAIAQARMAK